MIYIFKPLFQYTTPALPRRAKITDEEIPPDNLLRIKLGMDLSGFEPETFRMQSGRATVAPQARRLSNYTREIINVYDYIPLQT